MARASLDLDVDAPDKVPGVLNKAANAYYESEGELASTWGDRNAGKVWGQIAKILERAAAAIERVL